MAGVSRRQERRRREEVDGQAEPPRRPHAPNAQHARSARARGCALPSVLWPRIGAPGSLTPVAFASGALRLAVLDALLCGFCTHNPRSITIMYNSLQISPLLVPVTCGRVVDSHSDVSGVSGEEVERARENLSFAQARKSLVLT